MRWPRRGLAALFLMLTSLYWLLAAGAPGSQFALNLVALAVPGAIRCRPECWRWVRFLPLVATQAAITAFLRVGSRPGSDPHLR